MTFAWFCGILYWYKYTNFISYGATFPEEHTLMIKNGLKDTEGIPTGLTSEEVAAEIAAGHVNISDEKVGKSYGQIIKEHLFTFFNLIWLGVAVLLVLCNSISNMTFLAIVLPNIFISIFQEIRAKRTVEKLSVTTDPRATVIRDGELVDIADKDIVLGDVMLVELGRQVLSDAIVISGVAEANESMLTGEADAIKKQVGDKILAGSYLVSGSIYAKVCAVGKDNYVHKIEKEAKSYKAPSSNLFRELNKLIKSISSIIIPIAVILFLINFLSYKQLDKAIVTTCSSMIGMIPAGMYLLVTLTLTLSVVTLSKKKTLVQDMYSIEMLASADIVCLDKTGTITDGTMTVTAVTPLADLPLSEIERIMSHIEGTEQSINNTSEALIARFGKDVSVKVIKKVPFSSSRKYSAVSIKGLGAFSIGAPHFVPCPVSEELEALVEEHAKKGERVLLLSVHENLDTVGRAIALIAISDCIRPAAIATIKEFQDEGVTLKVISGDHAQTVSTIAKKVGIANSDKYISCESLTDEELVAAAEEYAIFGRVSPEQKVLIIKTLRERGHTVAMTGDGVNDTLALKESNCAIAMADGSEMARKVSQIVLLNSDFSTLPDVVREGRRCINNVRQSSSLFLMKTVFTVFLSLLAIITLSGFPFEPKQFILLEFFIIGAASFLLAIEPNNKRIEGSFIESVLIKSIPNAFALLIPVFALLIMEKFTTMLVDSRNSMAMSVVLLVGFVNLFFLCRPFTKWRVIVLSIIAGSMSLVIPVSIIHFDDFFHFAPAFHNPAIFFAMLGISLSLTVFLQISREKIEKILARKLAERKVGEAVSEKKRFNFFRKTK